MSGLFNNLDLCANPTLQALIREYKEVVVKEKKTEARRRIRNLKGKICIGSSIKNSRINLTGESTPEDLKNRIHAANSIGRLTLYADERRRLLSIVAKDYPYRLLQEMFSCSPNTATAAKVYCILFGRGGTPPSNFKCKRQCVSPDVLQEL